MSSELVYLDWNATTPPHPEVRRLPQLTRAHLEGFLSYNHRRPWRGRVARDQPVAASVASAGRSLAPPPGAKPIRERRPANTPAPAGSTALAAGASVAAQGSDARAASARAGAAKPGAARSGQRPPGVKPPQKRSGQKRKRR